MRRTYRKSGIKEIIITHIENNLKTYLILTIIFFIGLILGVMFVNNMSQQEKKNASEYIKSFNNKINSEEYEVSNLSILKASIKSNFLSFTFLWLLGCMIIGTPIIYGFIGYRGFALGYTVSAVVGSLGFWNGLLFVLGVLFLQNLIYIPSYFAEALSGIKLHKKIMQERKKEDIKINMIKHTIFSLLILIFIFIGTIIESYVSGGIMQQLLKKL